MSHPLGDLEQILLFAVARRHGTASGGDIREEVESRIGRAISPGAVYTVMTRLEERGLVTGTMAEATPRRGGRRRKLYHLEPAGARALAAAYDQIANMAHGVMPGVRRMAGAEDG